MPFGWGELAVARYQKDQLVVRMPAVLREKVRKMAAAEGVYESEWVREALENAVRKKTGGHAADPLTQTLHAVLPRYFQRLHDLVASARYDAIVAREMAQAAALAALLATGRDPEEARRLVQNTLGRATKTASRRMRERLTDLTQEASEGNADESATGA